MTHTYSTIKKLVVGSLDVVRDILPSRSPSPASGSRSAPSTAHRRASLDDELSDSGDESDDSVPYRYRGITKPNVAGGVKNAAVRPPCTEFNAKGVCKKPGCKDDHTICSKCKGKHSAKDCLKLTK